MIAPHRHPAQPPAPDFHTAQEHLNAADLRHDRIARAAGIVVLVLMTGIAASIGVILAMLATTAQALPALIVEAAARAAM
mgnify:CR=1 FL=1